MKYLYISLVWQKKKKDLSESSLQLNSDFEAFKFSVDTKEQLLLAFSLEVLISGQQTSVSIWGNTFWVQKNKSVKHINSFSFSLWNRKSVLEGKTTPQPHTFRPTRVSPSQTSGAELHSSSFLSALLSKHLQSRSFREKLLETMARSSRGLIRQHQDYGSPLGSDCSHRGVMAARQLNLHQQRHPHLWTMWIQTGFFSWSPVSLKHLKIRACGKCRCRNLPGCFKDQRKSHFQAFGSRKFDKTAVMSDFSNRRY